MKTYLKYIFISVLVLFLIIASYGKFRDGVMLIFQDIHQNVLEQISK